jgi:hypothetical protein
MIKKSIMKQFKCVIPLSVCTAVPNGCSMTRHGVTRAFKRTVDVRGLTHISTQTPPQDTPSLQNPPPPPLTSVSRCSPSHSIAPSSPQLCWRRRVEATSPPIPPTTRPASATCDRSPRTASSRARYLPPTVVLTPSG